MKYVFLAVSFSTMLRKSSSAQGLLLKYFPELSRSVSRYLIYGKRRIAQYIPFLEYMLAWAVRIMSVIAAITALVYFIRLSLRLRRVFFGRRKTKKPFEPDYLLNMREEIYGSQTQ